MLAPAALAHHTAPARAPHEHSTACHTRGGRPAPRCRPPCPACQQTASPRSSPWRTLPAAPTRGCVGVRGAAAGDRAGQGAPGPACPHTQAATHAPADVDWPTVSSEHPRAGARAVGGREPGEGRLTALHPHRDSPRPFALRAAAAAWAAQRCDVGGPRERHPARPPSRLAGAQGPRLLVCPPSTRTCRLWEAGDGRAAMRMRTVQGGCCPAGAHVLPMLRPAPVPAIARSPRLASSTAPPSIVRIARPCKR